MAIIHHPSLARYSLFNPSLFQFDKKLLITFVDNEKGFIVATGGNFSWNILSTVCWNGRLIQSTNFIWYWAKIATKKPSHWARIARWISFPRGSVSRVSVWWDIHNSVAPGHLPSVFNDSAHPPEYQYKLRISHSLQSLDHLIFSLKQRYSSWFDNLNLKHYHYQCKRVRLTIVFYPKQWFTALMIFQWLST